MKKLIFKASFLALATLTIFSACKKDEVIEPEVVEKIFLKKYSTIGCPTYNTAGELCAGQKTREDDNGSYIKPYECKCVE